ncbi:MAG: RluA family pseudouridine synthase [Kiritimatiellae bacterium]|nr:RluA family pseudouridine synthase [Kiritimatiellia bacterium]
MQPDQKHNLEWTVDKRATGQRVDTWLDTQLPDHSRSSIRRLIDAGHLQRNGAPPKPHQKLQEGDHLLMHFPQKQSVIPQPEALPLDLLFEDDHIAVLNKTPGMVVHPAPGHHSGTLVNALLHRFPQLKAGEANMRPGIVHRLDRDTSGVLIVALTPAATDMLMQQFKSGQIEKRYDAIVSGCPRPPNGRIETLIARHPKDRKRMAVSDDHGKLAITEFTLKEAFSDGSACHLDVRIETGRTHQIRVHLATRGHPVLGDTVYARRRPAPWPARQMLHAREISFLHPDNQKRLTFNAPAPDDMVDIIGQLRAMGTS